MSTPRENAQIRDKDGNLVEVSMALIMEIAKQKLMSESKRLAELQIYQSDYPIGCASLSSR